ncbi:TPA: helix-turn-helix transcriptional regulator [Pseudomonas aeruginosa]
MPAAAIISTDTWKGRLNMGLAPRELEATLYAASDLTAKQIAKMMGIAPGTVSKRLDDARFKLGSKTVRGLVLEAYRRQIISPVTQGESIKRDRPAPKGETISQMPFARGASKKSTRPRGQQQ